MAEPSWLDAEPGARVLGQELVRLIRRAACRPIWTIGLAFLLAAGFSVRRALRKPGFRATVTLRVSEGDLDPNTAPKAQAELRDYVSGAILSTPTLIEIIQRHHLAKPEKLAADPQLWVDSFRDDIGIDVYRNYFMDDPYGREGGRSARIAISYLSPDPEVSLDVARDLAQTVVSYETAARTAAAETALNGSQAAVEEEQDGLRRRQQELARLDGTALAGPTPGLRATAQVEADALRKTMPAAEQRVAQAEKAHAELELRLGLEARQMGLRFEVVDASHDRPSRTPRVVTALVIFVVTFPVLCFITALLVGAFDDRLHSLEDVRQLELPPLGRVPWFPGAAAGSLDARLRVPHHVE